MKSLPSQVLLRGETLLRGQTPHFGPIYNQA
jgi:hypothetical protein